LLSSPLKALIQGAANSLALHPPIGKTKVPAIWRAASPCLGSTSHFARDPPRDSACTGLWNCGGGSRHIASPL